MIMKKKALCAFSLILYILIAFTFLSLKIEEEMITLVQVREIDPKKYSSGTVEMPLKVLFEDTQGSRLHLYEVIDGTGWESGLRIREIPRGYWSIHTPEELTMPGGDNYRRVVQSASRQPTPGERTKIMPSRPERADDLYLAVYAREIPEVLELPSAVEVAARSDSALLLNATNMITPFFEHQAKGMAVHTDMAKRIFSLTDVTQFLENLPLIVLLACTLLAPLPIWLLSCLLAGSAHKNRYFLLLNTAAVIGLLAAAIALMGKIDLPSSLLPPVNIFSFDYYKAEFSQIFSALDGLGNVAPDVTWLAGVIPQRARHAAAVGLGLTAAFLLAEALALLLRARRQREE